MGMDMGVTGNSPFMAKNYKTTVHNSEKTKDFGEVLESESAKAQPGDVEDTDYRKQLQEKMDEMWENIRHGTIQPKFQIGAKEYTHEEWKELIEKIDEAEEDLREQLEAELEAARREAAKKEQEKDENELTSK